MAPLVHCFLIELESEMLVLWGKKTGGPGKEAIAVRIRTKTKLDPHVTPMASQENKKYMSAITYCLPVSPQPGHHLPVHFQLR